MIEMVLFDIFVLMDMDYDYGYVVLNVLLFDYFYCFVLWLNLGFVMGLDFDVNGWIGELCDGMGYGWFVGDGGLVILFCFFIDFVIVMDLSYICWVDLFDVDLLLMIDEVCVV